MTDMTLDKMEENLKLAAYAIGLEVLWKGCRDGDGMFVVEQEDKKGSYEWNPYERKQDALDLAYKLRFSISWGKHKTDGCTVEAPDWPVAGCTSWREPKESQLLYAVTQVAANVGKYMKDSEKSGVN